MVLCRLKTDFCLFLKKRGLAPWLHGCPQRKELPPLHHFGGPFSQESDLLAQTAGTGWVKTDRRPVNSDD